MLNNDSNTNCFHEYETISKHFVSQFDSVCVTIWLKCKKHIFEREQNQFCCMCLNWPEINITMYDFKLILYLACIGENSHNSWNVEINGQTMHSSENDLWSSQALNWSRKQLMNNIYIKVGKYFCVPITEFQ